MFTHASWRRGFVASAILGLVATPLTVIATSAPAQANLAGTNLVIGEVYGGGGSTSASASYKQDFVEIVNPTNASISLNGWSIQYRSATGSAANAVALPNKVVPANDRFLIGMGSVSTGGADLPATDATASTLNLAAASGLVILSNGTTALTVPTGNIPAGTTGVVDAVGYGATVTSFETARHATVGTTTISYVRSATGADGDNNSTDFSTSTPTPQAATGNTAASLAATNPGDQTATVGTAITGFTLAASNGTAPYSWTATGLPDGVSVAANGAVSGTPTAAGTFNVTATATDSATPTAASANTSFSITVAPAPLAATNPGDQTATAGTAITGFSLAATGGTTPYAWTATGLPDGVTVATNGDVSGTPTSAGTYAVTATVTDATTPTAMTTTTTFTITVEAASSSPVNIQILATNDFHGRIQNDTTTGGAGAAVLAGAVKQLRGVNPNTVFAAAGDLIGASTFESFIQKDKPTIDALNEAGLEVSAVGNHEFDQGYDDLVNRVMAPYSEDFNPYGGASWKYLGANVKFKSDDSGALDGTWVKQMDGVKVGFIGAVTEHLPELVSPGGIADIKVTDTVAASNAAANDLKAAGADVVVLLVHEGAAGTDCATINNDTTSDFGKITSGVNANIDAIVSGHTHLSYNCSQTVPAWFGRPVTTRPIVSAGQYGMNLNQINYTVDDGTGVVTNKTQSLLPLKSGTTGSTFNYPVDAPTQSIVTTAVNNANVLGAQPLGNIGGAFHRAKLANGTSENRGGESTLGNQVAEIQRWATSDPAFGAAQIAFMNPGGLRADLVGQGSSAYPRVVTYKDAANVQPFANTLVNEDLTGSRIKAALEQQWQPVGASRPFLKLGISKGFTYTYDPDRAQGSRITGMYLNGTAIDLDATYSVTANAFLTTGGDNFTALNGTGRKQDTGRTDLQAQVDYFAALGSDTSGIPVDSSQRSVGASLPGAPASYPAGGDVVVNLTSLSMTGPGDLHDTSVTASINGDALGSFPVTTTLQTQLPGYDEVGTATVVVTLPADLAGGDHELVITGAQTGTRARIPFTSDAPSSVATTVSGAADPITYGTDGTVTVTVTPSTATGTVELRDGQTLLGTGDLADGTASITVEGTALEVGSHDLTLSYLGAAGFDPSTGTVTVTVVKASTTVTGTAAPIVFGDAGSVSVSVTSSGGTPSGTVELRDGAVVVGSVTLVDGEGTITVPADALAVGAHDLTVAYLGGTSFESSTGTVTVTVVKASTTVTGTADPITYGKAGSVAVSVTSSGGTPAGTVELRDGQVLVGTTTLTDGGGTVAIPVDALSVGEHVLTLAYLGGTSFGSSSGTVTVTVVKASTTVTGTADPITYGKAGSVAVSVTSSSRTPAGTVELRNGAALLGTATVVDGAGTVMVPAKALAVGTHNLALTYLGSTGHAPAEGTVRVNVLKATPDVAVTTAASTVAVKSSTELTVRVSAVGFTPTGAVQILSGSTVVGRGTLSAGVASIDVGPFSDTGTLGLSVNYLGDDTTTTGSGSVSVKVVKQTPGMKITAPKKVRKNFAPTITVVLTGVSPQVRSKVTFRYDGRTVTRYAANGKVTLTLAKLTRTTRIKVRYAGNASYDAVTKRVKIAVRK